MKILAIESSCDETAAAVVEDGVKIRSSVVASSTAMHEKYGGIVPEVAAREQLKVIIPTIEEALKQANSTFQTVDAIAVAVGPGLIGSLLVGVETAKTIALTTGKPLIPVNHVLAHMFANFVDGSACHSRESGNLPSSRITQIPDQVGDDKIIEFPAISLVVSGGHTELFLMKSVKNLTWLGGTLDDAAGEAFDKTARLLGFGNRGGVAIQESATKVSGMDNQIKLPRPMMYDNTLNFSFSGLKTAILREVGKLKETNKFNDATIRQLAHEVQESITDVLVKKTIKAAEKYHAKSILISGGVSANLRLREKFPSSIPLFAPPIELCTDNAVYIASYAFFRGKPIDWHDITAVPDLSVENP